VTVESVYEGGCSCRKLRYRMNTNPLIVHACHCRQCQRVTGSAFVMNALVEKSQVETLCGDIAEFRFPDTYHTAFFCPECATYVWSEYKSGRFNDCWFIRVGTLDEPDRLPPSVHIFIDSKQPWVIIPEEEPRFERFYHIRDVWEESSIIRMGANWNPSIHKEDASS
jgi:hypothetical protein